MSALSLRADGGTRVLAAGRVLLGGSPLRLLRLSDAGARTVRSWLDGEPVGDGAAQRALARRLVHAGVLHPVYTGGPTTADVTVVVPTRTDGTAVPGPRAADGTAVPGQMGPAPDGVRVVVVDDGSPVPVPGAASRHPTPRGPAAARNTGTALVRTGLVAFLDADVRPEPGWLDALLPHFADPAVAAVAPRVRSEPGSSALARYEQARSPLDLGAAPAPVRPGGRVGYLPSAALVVRTAVLRELGGFDERLRFGEDVDLVWRIVGSGRQVRYEPAATVWHRPRLSWPRWLRQRLDYGGSAAPLALRHGSAVAPLRVSRWSALAWGLVAAGHPVPGVTTALATAALLPRKLGRLGVPAAESLRLALAGHLGAGALIADAVTRSWAPLAMPLLALSRRGRWVLAAALCRHLLEWRRTRPPLDPARFVLVRAADDLAYGAGVCWGCLRHRTVRPLLPDLSDWPGRNTP